MFRNEAAEFVYTRTYSRWIEEQGRRETWPETVKRYINFIKEERGNLIPDKVINKIEKAILNFEVMPSMRALWAAGPAAKADNTCLYNCSYAHIDSPTSFSEALYILMCGTGDGYSVQHKFITNSDKLPIIPKIENFKETIVIEDSKVGWANSVKTLMTSLYEGKDIEFDYSKLRPRGARLLTMGGRSSGPAPLITLHSYIREVFLAAQGRKLTTLECSDIRNQVADTVVVGGVRRSSQIAFSDLNDELMATAKSWPFHPRRQMANHSSIYDSKPSAVDFLKEWSLLASSGTGERGISNLEAARKNAPKRRNSNLIEGSNPCHEIMLRHKQFCNLSEVVVRAEDDLDDLLEKVETATWIGIIQSTFTYFPYLSKEWKINCEEERLLGVSLTGQLDNPELLTADALKALKAKAIKVARHASSKMNINMPASITCVKPSGTVSQLVDSASGLHTRFAEYYIRRYRISSTDPLFKMLKDQGYKYKPENGQENLEEKDITTYVLDFPIKAPKGSVTRDKMTAIDQLEHYKKIQTNWCEHNASMTIYTKESEWFEVGNWVYKNWDIINGVSFLPYDGGKYKLAPYEEITKEQYEKLVDNQIKIDYTQLSKYELEDNTEGAKSYNCTGDRCEIV
jgi:ribonucleoside-triphosphate reductase (thioredoxin)